MNSNKFNGSQEYAKSRPKTTKNLSNKMLKIIKEENALYQIASDSTMMKSSDQVSIKNQEEYLRCKFLDSIIKNFRFTINAIKFYLLTV